MISLIVAYAKNQVIGKDGDMPWSLPADLKNVKEITTGNTIVMGRKTFESIGRPLPNRRNVVLTRSRDFHPEGVDVVHTKEEVLALGDVIIFGGANIYGQFLDVVDRMYITEIELETEGDTFFPAWDKDAFVLVDKREGVVDEKNAYPHTFYVYERKNG
ncbi:MULTISPECIES: dihydrofolate reductase [Brevibacillus]|jgi:dihydrofolate reductase|uniref:Dihydrofolate reductase n=1 Tax=Brevibacillus parabrevis TaxID=54914 RepID=A0A4Y3PWG9_BREPA|nr:MULTISPECIES: dihydrofolate reductase [Brevibacillus]TGU85759.1 dihydrofolate reductase [Mesorhizobium sp. M00.F.Ca.ET.186.01.1.1]MBU8714543.1 dihydrofolate reductase [Brevibacillus parabrevis]MDH6351233.1 dihydrofolate reductase [Brevibacillus sp. 1238]MDR4998615.1 dihydrofolate reductase [Brevibacillus parabrevis]MED1723481.1 dihydrofolate reductase [Brevibacillus parabrevis]